MKDLKLEVLALVPARGGSKSIPRKNVRHLNGKPLIAHSIEHGLRSKHITRVVCTTDDSEIADVARQHGAEVPFMRPPEISGDFSVDFEFHLHALEWLRDNEGYVPDLVVQLRPTNPIRRIEVIDRAIELFARTTEADSLRAVKLACDTPYKMWRMGESGFLSQLLHLEGESEPYNMPRQKLPPIFQQDGYIDITRPRVVFEMNSTTGRKILPFMIDEETVDIDYEEELMAAESMLSKARKE
ncbi:MAG: acylneuraminate cytidylyltransferase family protein [Alphaproteobacteria bacterium]|nr:acylneuraminate cytidylyltransferase family protein [Alphaproteobacteria bacterium]